MIMTMMMMMIMSSIDYHYNDDYYADYQLINQLTNQSINQSINQPINEWMNEWSGLDGQRCVGRQHGTKKKWSDIWSMNASLIFISEINRHIPTPPMMTWTSNDIAAQFVISHFIIIIINEWMNEWMNEWRDWVVD